MANKIKFRRASALQKNRKAKGLRDKADSPEAQYRLGNACMDQGRFAEAVSCYRRALSMNPDFAEAHGNLGNVFKAQGKLAEAAASYRQALKARPDFSVVHYNLGNVLNEQGKLDEAAASYRLALSFNPDFIQACGNLGVTLHDQGKLDEALASFRRALTLKPDFVEAHCNLGKILHDQGQLEEAAASFRRALVLRPDFAEALSHLGVTLHAQGQLAAAVASFRRALALHPDLAEAHNNLGNVLKDQGQLEAAVASFRRVLALRPDLAEAHNNLGVALNDQGKLAEAVACFRRALAVKPDSAEAHNNLGNALKDQGKIEEAIASYRRALSLQPELTRAHSNLLFSLNYLASQTASAYLEEARDYGRKVAAMVGARFSDWTCAPTPERLRIGLVSGDFREHPVGFFLENILANLDPSRVELIAYPTHHEEDELGSRIRSRVMAWKSLLGLTDAAAARLIHDDGVHVLLDLSGHTSHNRLPVFAWKPAPVQASWLGYSASTGLAEMDYLLADPYVVPPSEEKQFAEAIWRLPECYLCFSPPRREVEVGSLPALEEGLITFGCFNNPVKINGQVIALWAKVLAAIPGSRLLLKAKQFGDSTFADKMRQRFVAAGIDSRRLLLEGFNLKRREHLAAYNRVDIALDPFPYNGTTTSIEGLWMGVPFIARRGERFIGHVGESIAHNAGLADWIAMGEEDYVEKVVAHTADLENLARLRADLRQQVLASPLLDARRFARNFEAALWGMWRCFSFARQNEAGRGRNK